MALGEDVEAGFVPFDVHFEVTIGLIVTLASVLMGTSSFQPIDAAIAGRARYVGLDIFGSPPLVLLTTRWMRPYLYVLHTWTL
jgi:hypothetical protein